MILSRHEKEVYHGGARMREERADDAEANGISRHTYFARIKYGWDHERASTVPVGLAKTGTEMSMVYRLAQQRGIPVSTARTRRKMGWSDWEIVNIPYGERRKHFYQRRAREKG